MIQMYLLNEIHSYFSDFHLVCGGGIWNVTPTVNEWLLHHYSFKHLDSKRYKHEPAIRRTNEWNAWRERSAADRWRHPSCELLAPYWTQKLECTLKYECAFTPRSLQGVERNAFEMKWKKSQGMKQDVCGLQKVWNLFGPGGTSLLHVHTQPLLITLTPITSPFSYPPPLPSTPIFAPPFPFSSHTPFVLPRPQHDYSADVSMPHPGKLLNICSRLFVFLSSFEALALSPALTTQQC